MPQIIAESLFLLAAVVMPTAAVAGMLLLSAMTLARRARSSR